MPVGGVFDHIQLQHNDWLVLLKVVAPKNPAPLERLYHPFQRPELFAHVGEKRDQC